jgi:soluble lytic murein transglycosylase-like protein
MSFYWRVLCLLLMGGIAFTANAERSLDPDKWTRKYDRYFRKYTKHYFGPHFNWRWFKAQAIAESNLNPKARSHVGAMGIMQIMPRTYTDIKKKNPHFFSVNTPKWNIAAGIYYDRYLYRKWQKGFSTQERLALMFGGYNAGHGTMRKAYKKALKKHKKVRKWSQVAGFAPKETQNYVKRIRRYMKALQRE